MSDRRTASPEPQTNEKASSDKESQRLGDEAAPGNDWALAVDRPVFLLRGGGLELSHLQAEFLHRRRIAGRLGVGAERRDRRVWKGHLVLRGAPVYLAAKSFYCQRPSAFAFLHVRHRRLHPSGYNFDEGPPVQEADQITVMMGFAASLSATPKMVEPWMFGKSGEEKAAETRKAARTAATILSLLLLAMQAPARCETAGPDLAIAQPVIARHGMVVCQEAAACHVGLEILKKGGNAVDAAVAVGFALAVTLPRAGNLGGGGFMLIHSTEAKRTVAIDYRETAPALTTKDVFLTERGEADRNKSLFSGLAIGVPGTVAGLEFAWRKYGSGRFSFAELVAPAAALARRGLTVDDDLADSLPLAAATFSRHPSSARIYLRPDKTAPQPGDHIALDDLAATLETIASQGAAGFYTGPVAEKIVASVRDAGGRMSLQDLASYHAVEREPVRGTYRGREIVSMPPPSSGGAHIIEIANILEGFPLREQGFNSAETIHEMAEAEKLAYADRSLYLGDPDFTGIPLIGLTSKAYAEVLRRGIEIHHARPASEIAPGRPERYESDQTTHFSIVDDKGNAVSNTYTLNIPYGSGLVAEGTGVLLNDELDDFSSKPGAPNRFGLLGGDANAPAPGKRPLSSMSPTMVFKDGALELVTGAAGGSRIISIVLQIILDTIDHGLNVAEAEEAPRVHHQWQPDELRIEHGISPDTIRLLESFGHKVVVREAMGSAYTIGRKDGLLTGSADPRHRGTSAVGY